VRKGRPTMDPRLALALAFCTGIGLAAAAGFRVFVPLLALSLAARAELVPLSDGFGWIGSTPALVVFATATALEIAGYFVPFVDNLLDAIATPAATIAGALLATAVLVDLDPWLRWTVGVVAGAGAAAAVQVPTAALRGGSSTTTAGLANPFVAAAELVGSTIASAIAVLAPLFVPLALVGIAAAAVAWRRRRRRRAKAA